MNREDGQPSRGLGLLWPRLFHEGVYSPTITWTVRGSLILVVSTALWEVFM